MSVSDLLHPAELNEWSAKEAELITLTDIVISLLQKVAKWFDCKLISTRIFIASASRPIQSISCNVCMDVVPS